MNSSRKQKRGDLSVISDFLERPLDSVMNILERPIGTFRDFLKESPVFDIAETEKEVNVRVEVPGLSQDELSVSYSEGILTVSGEKKEQKREKNRRRGISGEQIQLF